MTTSWQEYENRIKRLGLVRQYSITSIAEARSARADLVQMQKELRLIKREIDADIKAIRAQFTQRMVSAAQTTSGILSVFGRKGMAGSIRADEKRRLKQEQDRILQPYLVLKLAIDSQILEYDKTKAQIDGMIAAAKS